MDEQGWETVLNILEGERGDALDNEDDEDERERAGELEKIIEDIERLKAAVTALETEGYYCWGDFGMTCSEANALRPLWEVAYGLDVAEEIMAVHASKDEEGDEHYLAPGKVKCQWFTLCENDATTTEPHPVLGDVPICQRCQDTVRNIEKGLER